MGGKAVALNEIASKRGHNYITIFIDLDRKQKPAIFVTPGKGKGKGCLALFRRFLREYGAFFKWEPRWSGTWVKPAEL
ncbi:hypothetical protein DFAR_3280004 [Desulfarculales bacterium]